MTKNHSRRFPVRWLLLAGFVLVAIALGLMVRHQVQKTEEEAARKAELVVVGKVEQLGGHVKTNHAGLVVWLNLNNTTITDAGLKELVGLKQLQTLGLSSTQVTDAGLKELKEALPKCRIER